MSSSLAEQLRSKLRRGLQPTTTKVTTADGRVTLYENQGKETVQGTTTVASCGYVVDMKPDLSINYVLPWLCITSQDVPREPRVLQKENITHVLSLLPGFLLDQEVISILVEHKIVEILDEDNINGELTEDAKEKIFDAVAYIQNAHKANPSHKVLVHCNAGISRAPTIVILYLIFYENMDFYTAWQVVKSNRVHAKPNRTFWNYLQKASLGLSP